MDKSWWISPLFVWEGWRLRLHAKTGSSSGGWDRYDLDGWQRETSCSATRESKLSTKEIEKKREIKSIEKRIKIAHKLE